MAKTAKLGDPALFETQVGPVTTPPQYRKILSYIDIAKGEGAKCVLGGGAAPQEEGGGQYFVKPTIFTGVSNKMRIARFLGEDAILQSPVGRLGVGHSGSFG
jgi:acyl-CoA reductase-like NAD-dependent aldehyde dehydrogenase